jgi:magnesium chelatase subunit D
MADLALDATLRAAAPSQRHRRAALASAGSDNAAASDTALLIEPWDVQVKVREARTGSLILFLVDASGSMGAQRRMVAVKGAILSLLLDAYQRRDRVGLISFRGAGADLLLPPTGSVDLAQAQLQDLPTGGRTPLGQGLHLALDVIERERLKDREVLPLLVLLSDGRANVPLGRIPPPGGQPDAEAAFSDKYGVLDVASLIRDRRISAVVVDTEAEFIKLGLARPIAEAMGATYLRLEDLRAESLAQAVRLQLPLTQPAAAKSGQVP